MTFSERGGWWVAAQVGLFGGVLAAAWNLGPDVVAGPWRLAGTSLFWVGVAFGLAGAASLGRNITPFPAPTASAQLRTNGVFGLVRHPIYGAVILIFVGIGIKSGSWLATILALLLFPFFWAKSTYEERLLARRFDGYDTYRQQVTRRFLPWLV